MKKYLVLFILMIGLVAAEASFSGSNDIQFSNSVNNVQFGNPSYSTMSAHSDISTYWPTLAEDIKNDQCGTGTDFLVMIPPAGCSPMVVRSDLLAEQNVPVMCKLEAVRVNPLIQVSTIKSISFRGKYPEDISAVSYHPSQAAIRSYSSLSGNPTVENIGYVVLILKKQQNESAMKKWVSGNLTATINFDATNAFGVGQAEFYLESMNDEEWAANYKQNSFWSGRGFLRVIDVYGDEAKIGIYTDQDNLIKTITVKEGKTSDKFYFPGFYCRAGMRIKLDGIVSDEDTAILTINGDEIQVRKGSKILDGRCTIASLKASVGGTGNLEIKCSGQKTITLSLVDKNKAKIGEKYYGRGEKIEGTKYYVAYSGNLDKSLVNGLDKGTEYVVVVNKSKGGEISESELLKIENRILTNFDKPILSKTDFENFESGVKVYYKDDFVDNLKFGGLYDKTFEESSGADEIESELTGSYIKKMMTALDELIENYPQARDGVQAFGEVGIVEEIKLNNLLSGRNLMTDGRKTELSEKFMQLYPESSLSYEVQKDVKYGDRYDNDKAMVNLYINSDYNRIALTGFKKESSDMKGADMYIGDKFFDDVKVRSKYPIGESEDSIEILEINRGSVKAIVRHNVGDKVLELTEVFREDTTREILKSGDNYLYKITFRNIKVKEVAKISIDTEKTTRSEANFTYKIGIEQRAFPISPEKANETASKLNETIKKWEDANAKLGKLVESWKAACLATSAVLQVKTLFSGFSGASTSRQNVMNYYRDQCDASNKNSGDTRSECYRQNSTAINSDVEAYKIAIQAVNSEIEEKTIDEWKKNPKTTTISDLTEKLVGITIQDLTTWEDVRQVLLYENIRSSKASDGFKQEVKKKRDNSLQFVAASKIAEQNLKNSQGLVPKDRKVISISSSVVPETTWDGGTCKGMECPSTCLDCGDNTAVQFVSSGAGTYLLILEDSFDGKKKVRDVYLKSGSSYELVEPLEKKDALTAKGGLTSDEYNEIKRREFSIGTVCSYGYKAPYTVSYYQSGKAKGFPSKVPIDIVQGWYVKVKDSAGGILSDSNKGYLENGAVSSYTICNVGEDTIENSLDLCQTYNINQNDVDSFGGCSMSASEVKKLKNDAQEAIRQAQRGYGKDKFQISISGRKSFQVGVENANVEPEAECESFMTPEDCNLMFNVCDPVICPTSRCNFGGSFPVANVIQSGIVGSVLLCLPNFGMPSDGGVIIPVCLTGVHAGIEGYISILKAEQECMMEAARTGKHTGICDEMTAIYKCEFFWRQAAPIMSNIVPRMAEMVMGGDKKKGGGEYLTFQDSWDNMEKSISYFKNTYASTSFRAFQFGNVEEIGTEVCNSFVGTSIPTSGKALDSLLKPESPPQFYSQFSEIPLTEATVPPTSQYKVYYHIYAGTDEGVRYQIYLKNPPQTSYVYTSQTVAVKSGYIAAGGQVDEAKDFSAPAGYKELCVAINNQEECGFKQVTSDFGIDYLHDAYAKQQANSTATTEKECISGTDSMLALANLNVQEGISEAVNPDITLRGVVRVCASQNPGYGTSESNRWKPAGNCGNGMQCWLDSNSLKEGALNILSNSNNLAQAEENVNKINTLDIAFDQKTSLAKLEELKNEIGKLSVGKNDDESKIEDKINKSVFIADEMDDRGYTDSQRAEGIYLKFKIFMKVVNGLTGTRDNAANDVSGMKNAIPANVANSVTTSSSVPVTQEVCPKKVRIVSEVIQFDCIASVYKITLVSGTIYKIVDSNGYTKATITKDKVISVTSSSGLLNLNGCTFDGNDFSCP
jgi:hypothetical protein